MSQHLGDRAAAYVDGALDPLEAARARAHLETCPGCRATVEEQERVRAVLRATDGVGPPADLMAVLASMPVAGPPARSRPPAGTPRRTVSARRAAICCVAVGATVLGTAWVVGGPVTAVGPPSVPPANLLAQHSATAGELPFWGARSESISAAPLVARKERQRRDAFAAWVTRDPSSILRRAATASSGLSYEAVEQVTTYSGAVPVTQVSEVSHISGQGTSTRPVAGTGSARASFQPQVVGSASSSLDAVTLLQRTYRVRAEGVDVVAGRPVDRLAVHAQDGSLVARFWIDRASGLPLARESSRDGRPSVTNRITALTLADRSDMPDHLPMATSANWGEAVGIPAEQAMETLQGEGWVCPKGLAVAAGMQAFDVLVADGDASASQGQVLHIIFTDGLRSVSVFQQHAVLSPDRLAGFRTADVAGAAVYRKDSDPTEVTWTSGGTVFTVVGDAPGPVIERVVSALPHERAAGMSDMGSRTGRGLARVGSWFDPFG